MERLTHIELDEDDNVQCAKQYTCNHETPCNDCEQWVYIAEKVKTYEDLGTPEQLAEMKAELRRFKTLEAQRHNENCGNCKFWGEMSGKCMSDCSNAGMVNRVSTDSCD